jgi:hypothetical protein
MPSHTAVLQCEEYQQAEVDLDGLLPIHFLIAWPISGARSDDVSEKDPRAGEADQVGCDANSFLGMGVFLRAAGA